jgi:hypothetical protein
MKNLLTLLLYAALVLGAFLIGKTLYPSVVTETITETEFVYDTIWREIEKTEYDTVYLDSISYAIDTTYLDTPVDTTEILRDYFATVYLTRKFENEDLSVVLSDVLSRNRIVDWTLDYSIKRPSQITNNITSVYNRYLTVNASLSTVPEAFDFSLLLVNDKYIIGLGYVPALRAPKVTLGYTIKKFH